MTVSTTSSILKHPAIQSLIDGFANEILEVSRQTILEDVKQRIEGSFALALRASQKPVKAKTKRKARSNKSSKPRQKLYTKPRNEPASAALPPFLQPVSGTVLEFVMSQLNLVKEASSHEIADALGYGETSVRMALKTLMAERKVSREKVKGQYRYTPGSSR